MTFETPVKTSKRFVIGVDGWVPSRVRVVAECDGHHFFRLYKVGCVFIFERHVEMDQCVERHPKKRRTADTIMSLSPLPSDLMIYCVSPFLCYGDRIDFAQTNWIYYIKTHPGRDLDHEVRWNNARTVYRELLDYLCVMEQTWKRCNVRIEAREDFKRFSLGVFARKLLSLHERRARRLFSVESQLKQSWDPTVVFFSWTVNRKQKWLAHRPDPRELP